MDQELIDAVRQVLEEQLVPELRMLAEKVEQGQRKLQHSVSVLSQNIESVQQEMLATRAEVVQLRKELQATRDEVLGSSSPSRLIH